MSERAPAELKLPDAEKVSETVSKIAEQSQRLLQEFVERQEADGDGGEFEQVTPPEEAAAATRRMFGVSDTESGSLGARLLAQAVGAMESLGGGVASASELNDAAALLEGIAPGDAVEGMLAVQMVTAHSAAMPLTPTLSAALG